ncbi:MAG: hypothetical protein OXH68_05000 [Gammaproteobacteria bacterium]|nr:hypothetical protein [Gammaproteobacteria bacterium]
MSKNQLEQNGLTGPLDLADRSVTAALCEVVLRLNESKKDDRHVNPELVDRHRDLTVIGEVFADANLRSATTTCFGTGLMLWRSNFIVKDMDSREASWQHSRLFEDADAPLDIYNTDNHFTVLLAVTAMGFAYISGSHLPMEGLDRMQLGRHVVELPHRVRDRVREMEFEPGQFALFHSSLLHRNQPILRADPPGILMAGRLVRAGTKIPERFSSPGALLALE